jgi:hypothetical protein
MEQKKRPWDIWKEKNPGDSVRPWDLMNPKIGRVSDEVYKERYENNCLKCDRLIQATKTCKECGCFMSEKCKLPHASCPIGKWDAVKVSLESEGEPNDN